MLALALMLVLMLSAPAAAMAGGGSKDTVRISGTAYAFFDIDDRVPGAVVRVEEYPGISDSGRGRRQLRDRGARRCQRHPLHRGAGRLPGDLYLQTFHTAGKDLEHVNFQVVPSAIYAVLAGLLGVPVDESGQIEECVIVSTFSIHEARDATTFDPGFKDVYPHGLPGATATIDPVAGNTRGPIYFNEAIIPDPAETSSSVDGGVLWVEVPPGLLLDGALAPDRAARPVPRPLRGRPARQREPALGLLRAEGRRAAGPGGAGEPARHHRRRLRHREADPAAEGQQRRRRGQGQGEGGVNLEARAKGRIKLDRSSYRLKPKRKSLRSELRQDDQAEAEQRQRPKEDRPGPEMGKRARAKLTVKLTDEADNTKTEKLAVRLIGR